jgi:hypothetical protein
MAVRNASKFSFLTLLNVPEKLGCVTGVDGEDGTEMLLEASTAI